MGVIYFKFKSVKNFDIIPIDGNIVSVGSLKYKIFMKKQLYKGTDFDILITHARTNEGMFII